MQSIHSMLSSACCSILIPCLNAKLYIYIYVWRHYFPNALRTFLYYIVVGLFNPFEKKTT